MHFVLIADAYPPMKTSAAVQLRDLSHEFVRQGHQLTVILPDSNLKTKENILDKTLFENVLKEIQLAESTFKISKKKNKTSTEELLASTYSEIYKKNNISELDFFTSLNFYSENPKELEEVYSNVLELLISERPITDQK